jgi:hypothetical protein
VRRVKRLVAAGGSASPCLCETVSRAPSSGPSAWLGTFGALALRLEQVAWYEQPPLACALLVIKMI